MVSLKKKAISLCCALTLAASMVPSIALAGGEEESQNDGPAIVLTATATTETSAFGLGGISLFSLDSVGPVPLKPTNEVKWIDRIDFTGHEYAIQFYDALVEATDNDGYRDYLIDDKYRDGTAVDDEIYQVGGYYQAGQGMTAAVVPLGTSAIAANDVAKREVLYVQAALAAFDRDHPEVFWLNDSSNYLVGTVGKTLFIWLKVDGASRSPFHESESKIKSAINARDANTSALLNAAEGCKSDVEKIESFNHALTTSNAYNTTDVSTAAGQKALKADYPDAWECVSALAGGTGTEGPVCEGYARAFKVLCDRSNIPCVLVDGYSDSGEPHMWNYVQADDLAWYGMDVTWNDPGRTEKAISGKERTVWSLVGANTLVEGRTFLDSHEVRNRVFADYIPKEGAENATATYHPEYINGPELCVEAFNTDNLWEIEAPKVEAVYGQYLNEIAVPIVTVSKNGSVVPDATVKWGNANQQLRAINQSYARAMISTTKGVAQVAYLPIQINKKVLSVTPGTVASKTSNGTTDASFSKAPVLSGVLSGDDVRLVATAKFADAAVGNNKRVNITYSLAGKDAGNYTLASQSATATANITAPPVATKPTTSTTGGSASAGKPSTSATTTTSKPATTTVKVKPPTLKKLAKPTVRSSKKKTLTVTWKKGATVTWQKKKYTPTAYIVQYSTNAKFKKGVKKVTVKVTKALSKKSKLSTTLKKLPSKKTYYVRVAAQYKIGGKTYTTPYVVSKKVKVK